MSRWWRAYDDAVNDPKLQLLPDALFRAWFNIMCIASKEGGELPPLAAVAYTLHVKPEKAAAILSQLHRAGLLDKTASGFKPHNWDGRQYKTDSSAERVQKYRDKRKAAGLPALSHYGKFKPELIERDGEQCVYCEATVPLVVDHMVPISLGGSDDLDNLALACKPCNSGKSGRTPEQAKLIIRVSSASDALRRYRLRADRDRSHRVTVSVTAPETDTETDIDVAADARAKPNPSFDLAEKLLVIAGHDPKFWPPGWCGAPMRVATWLSQGWKPEVIIAAVTAAASRKRGPPANSVNFFENAIAEEVARQAAPLPTVEIRQPEKITVTHGKSQQGGSLIGAIDRQLAELERAQDADTALPTRSVLRISH